MSNRSSLISALLLISYTTMPFGLPKKWSAASDYAKMVYQGVIPGAAGAFGIVGGYKALSDAHEEEYEDAKRNLRIIGITSLIASVDAEITAIDGLTQKSRRPYSQLTNLLLGLCRITNTAASIYPFISEYKTRQYLSDEDAQELVNKYLLPYIAPALISSAKGLHNLVRACRPQKKSPAQLRELSPTNAPATSVQ